MKKFILGILISLTLGVWSIFAQNTLFPDEAKVEVKDTIHENESANLEITMMRNWSKMNDYVWVISIRISDENWNSLKTNEYTLPNNGTYKFEESDLFLHPP